MKQIVFAALSASALLEVSGCRELDARLDARDGYSAYAQGHYVEAVSCYRDALEAKPDDLLVARNLAYAHLASARTARVIDDRNAHLRAASDLLIPLAHAAMRDPALALQAAASTLDWLRLTISTNIDEERTLATGAYESALTADAIGQAGAALYASLLLRERARRQTNVMDARADLERADDLEHVAHVREGVATVDLVIGTATP